MQVKHFVAEEEERLDLYLAQRMELSRSAIQKLIEEAHVLVNNKEVKKNYKLEKGERISLSLLEKEELKPEEMDIQVLYEDDDLAVINKPAGLTVHPGSGQLQGTLVSGLLATNWPLSTLGGEDRPGIVHRLDKDTSGLLLIAKNNKTHAYLQEQIKDRKITRKYLALVHGVPKWEEQTVEGYLERHPKYPTTYRLGKEGRYSRSYFRKLEEFDDCSLLECKLDTGRTHQLRVHLKLIHHPVLGDPVYGPRKNYHSLTHQMLHAFSLEFVTEQGEKIDILLEPPEEFRRILRQKESVFLSNFKDKTIQKNTAKA